ncbi:carbohydrate-binding protein [Beutenbergia cavernae DSM 12333]|uniref:Carbohydrate-binding protein n=1 Tax=Beutenbergia cavernae (strain ATCC BAA-8 / DSM 12333 / CCUG 43141 / JCM 11478 / NBRC 16432 / NCIMB 13614 / HKI 0122) TaxID=471853 RepID=C5C3X4_BEUC1|nr:carbohydrate-binding protein [Beutenbergia cavernae DSM 12333]
MTALLAAGATAVVAGPAAASEAPSPATVVAQLTGVDATTDTAAQWGVTGTDLGIMWDDGAGGVLTAFGDTFGDWTGPGGGGGDWRSNVLLRSTDTDLADGMTFDSAVEDTPGHAGEIIPSLKQPGVEHTTIPTAGIEVDGVQYLAFMSVRQWGPPGQWDTNFSRIAYSSDGGQTWNSTDGPTWENPGAATSEGDHPFQMVAFERRDGYLYMFGTPNGRLGAAHVARVAEADILDKAAYEYWTGEGWESGEGADVRAAEIVAPNVAELSVRYDAHSQRWLMTHLDQNLDLVLLSAPSPEGPWADRQVVASFADYPGLYGGYIHPWSPDGELYIALSQWDPYNVFLIRVGLTADGQISRANLLADPSFERQPSTATSDPWVCSGNCGTDNNHTWAFAGGKNGFVRNDSGWNSLHQTVRVEPNTDYRFSAWLRTSPNNDAGYVGVRGSNFQVISEHNFQAVADWTRYDVAFNSGDRTSVQVFAGIWTNNGDMWLQVDDFSLARATDPPPAPDPGSVDLRVRAHVQCRGGEAVVEVTAQNRERTPSDIRIVTAWGDARFTGVERNDRVSERFETGTDELDAGTLYVDGYTWRDDRAQNQRYEVDYRARSC